MKPDIKDFDSLRRKLLVEQINAYKGQIQRLQRRVDELESFRGWLDSTAKAIAEGASTPPSKNGGKTLAGYIAQVLTAAIPKALAAPEIGKRVESLGYSTSAKTALPQKIRAELLRQIKKGGLGIVRTGRGKYTIRDRH